MAAARLLVEMRQRAKEAAARLRSDKQVWLTDQAEGVAAELAAGRSGKLWALVRQVAGRRGRKGPKAAVVLKDARGKVLQSVAEIAGAWQERFLEEFLNRGQVVSDAGLHEVLLALVADSPASDLATWFQLSL